MAWTRVELQGVLQFIHSLPCTNQLDVPCKSCKMSFPLPPNVSHNQLPFVPKCKNPLPSNTHEHCDIALLNWVITSPTKYSHLERSCSCHGTITTHAQRVDDSPVFLPKNAHSMSAQNVKCQESPQTTSTQLHQRFHQRLIVGNSAETRLPVLVETMQLNRLSSLDQDGSLKVANQIEGS